jgi:transcriptional regulator of acetoin/glycerol metabolism
MSDRRDPITWVIDWMMAHEPAISQDLALRCEAAARREWGGHGWEYFSRTSRREKAATERSAHAAVLTTNHPIHEIARVHGMSRATLYRLVKRGPAGE